MLHPWCWLHAWLIMLTMAPWDHGTPWAQLTMRRCVLLPLLLVLCGQGAAAMDRGLRARTGARAEKEKEFNLTTISPDDETIDTLIDAVDSAVGTLQSAIDYSDYPQSFDNEEEPTDAFTGEGDYYEDPPPSISDYGADYEDVDEDEYDDYEYYDSTEEVDEYEDSGEEEEGEEEGEIVIEEATAGAEILNSTVSSSTIYAQRERRGQLLTKSCVNFSSLMTSHPISPLFHPFFISGLQHAELPRRHRHSDHVQPAGRRWVPDRVHGAHKEGPPLLRRQGKLV